MTINQQRAIKLLESISEKSNRSVIDVQNTNFKIVEGDLVYLIDAIEKIDSFRGGLVMD